MFESLCGNCNHKNCCTDSAVPLVFPDELEKIKSIDPKYSEHTKLITIKGKQIAAIDKKKNSTECVFWDSNTGGCSIYESRPIDCKLYPFDILYLDNSYHWIVYSCNKDSDWKWSESHLQTLEKSTGFSELMNNIDFFSEHTNMVLPKESEKTPYKVLRSVKWDIH